MIKMESIKSELKDVFGKLNFGKAKIEEKNDDELYLEAGEGFGKIAQELCSNQFLLVSLFAEEIAENEHRLHYVFEKKGFSGFLILFKELETEVDSIASIFPSACWYEREITDGFGISFNGSFDKRRLFLHEAYPEGFHPLKKSFHNGKIKLKNGIAPEEEYKFKEVHGEGVYQIPVGPVHAGIIEPGHFRFSVIGETIFNLEIRHFWKHRGIEKLAEGKSPEDAVALAEAISGDETAANSWGYCMAVEKIYGIKIPERAEHLRIIFAEMERIYSLLGDLAGMIIDVAYASGASPFFIIREEIFRWNEKLSGSRFFKGSLCIGGVKKNPGDAALKELAEYLSGFSERLKKAVEHILRLPSVLDRFETAGAVKKELIAPLHLSGPLARASGAAFDTRLDHAYGFYGKIVPSMYVREMGDVLARFKTKSAVIRDSVSLISQSIVGMPEGEIKSGYSLKNGFALSCTESCRGQNFHFLRIEDGKISRYKVRTASFCNWHAIEHAVLGNIVPDFPLINKSMNLSYAGNDL